MKTKTIKISSIIFAFIFALAAFSGCSASKPSADPGDRDLFYLRKSETGDELLESPSYASPPSYDKGISKESSTGSDTVITNTAELSEKIIYTAQLRFETTRFDESAALVTELMSSFGGFIENSNISGNTYRKADGTSVIINRYGTYVLRIPTENFESFLGSAGPLGNLVNQSRNASNITSAFTDTQARLDSYRIQEERLLAMLAKAERVEDLIALESRLSEIRYSIESLTRQLKNWQTQVDYSTITIYLVEVEEYTPTAPVVRTFGQKIADAFSNSLKAFARGFEGFVVGLVYITPLLLVWGAIAAVVIVIVFRVRGKKRARAALKDQAPPQDKQ